MLENPLRSFLPADQADLTLILIVTIPLSYLLSLTYNKYLFLALTMTLTMSFQSYIFPTQKWLLWGQQQLVYVLLLVCPRRIVGHVIILESFLALTLLQLQRVYESYAVNRFDVTGIFMMQLFNYIGLGYNYQNGAKSQNQLSSDQQSRRVVDRPSYLTYLGYVNFVPACLVGPSYEYVDFQNYMERRKDYVNIPNVLPAVFRECGTFIFSVSLYFALSSFPLDYVIDPVFDDYSLVYKLGYCMLAITHIELKYIAAWSLGMVSMRASGITYRSSGNLKKTQKNIEGEQGKNEAEGKSIKEESGVIEHDFGRIEVNNMSKFYLDPSFKVKVDHWNMSIVAGLRRYVYENVCQPRRAERDQKYRRSRQMVAQFAVALLSSLWHGVYPGYFFSFVHWVLWMQVTHQIFRLRKNPLSFFSTFNSKYPLIFNLVENFLATFVMTYFGMAFHLMTWDKVWASIKVTRFIPYIILYTAYILVVVLKVLTPKRPRQQRHKLESNNNKTDQNSMSSENKTSRQEIQTKNE